MLNVFEPIALPVPIYPPDTSCNRKRMEVEEKKVTTRSLRLPDSLRGHRGNKRRCAITFALIPVPSFSPFVSPRLASTVTRQS